MYVTNRVKGAAYRGAVQVLRGKREASRMASRKYNWPIDDLNGGNVGRHSGMGDRVYLFPSTVPEQGSIPALDPSSLAPPHFCGGEGMEREKIGHYHCRGIGHSLGCGR